MLSDDNFDKEVSLVAAILTDTVFKGWDTTLGEYTGLKRERSMSIEEMSFQCAAKIKILLTKEIVE